MTTALETLSNAFSEIITRTSAAVVVVKGTRSASTGIHWRRELIITSCEALRPGDRFGLGLPNGQTTVTELLGSDLPPT